MKPFEGMDIILTDKPQKSVQRIRRLKLCQYKYGDVVRVIETTTCAFIILATAVQIPSLYRAVSDLNRITAQQRNRDAIFQARVVSLLKTPTEIQTHLLQYFDLVSLLRLSMTCKHLRAVCMQDTLWLLKLSREWPDHSSKTVHQKKTRLIQTSSRVYKSLNVNGNLSHLSPGYVLYRQRYISYLKYTHRERSQPVTLQTILRTECTNALRFYWNVLIIPPKICGFLTLPVFFMCKYRTSTISRPFETFLAGIIQKISHQFL